ncbi:hypothetical protein [Negadavirga shengliensis]|uniref:Uncharacterized protein n=1 Tax=Negadavirga shengliensis TaxID=1389218 RepID=A0ABV9T058_9BACT
MNRPKGVNEGFGMEIPPLLEHVKIYFLQKELSLEEAEIFFHHHENIKWNTKKGTPIKNWKAYANEWIWNLSQ